MMEAWKILLADDDPEDRAIIEDALELDDAHGLIAFAENGEQALALLEQGFNRDHIPCLIVLDLNMPRLNGTQTLGKLKDDERFKDIPVIIYSTSINPLEKEKCMSLGAQAYITKPISYKESKDTIQLFLQYCIPKIPI